MVMSKRKEAVSEHCDVVARKMGQNPIPLICVLFKTFDQTLFSNFWSSFASLTVIIPVSFIIKTLTSMYILKQSCKVSVQRVTNRFRMPYPFNTRDEVEPIFIGLKSSPRTGLCSFSSDVTFHDIALRSSKRTGFWQLILGSI